MILIRRRSSDLPARMSVFGLGADVIAGFPGETDADHAATVALVERLPFTYLHVFPFSLRPGTAAERLPAPVLADRRAAAGGGAARHRRAKGGGLRRVARRRNGGRRRRGQRRRSARGSPAITFRFAWPTRRSPRGARFAGTPDHERQPPHGAVRSSMTDPRPTVYVETYGCQMNVSDSELMLGKLAAHGYDAVERPGRRGRDSRQHLRDSRARRAARDRPAGRAEAEHEAGRDRRRDRVHGAAARAAAAARRRSTSAS